MTRTQLITEVARRLGETSSTFTGTHLSEIFDRTLEEMASHGVIQSLRQTHSSAFLVAGQRTYSTRTIANLSSPDFPLDIIRIIVPAWGASGFLERVNEEELTFYRLLSTKSDGTAQRARPQRWCLYPNDQQIMVDPAPTASDAAASVEVLFVAPPTAIAGGTDITELRREHLHVLMAGMVKHGLVFQDETIIDRPTAIREFELGLLRMKGEVEKEHGRARRQVFRDF